jgi:hypothetical protein
MPWKFCILYSYWMNLGDSILGLQVVEFPVDTVIYGLV